MSEPAWEWDAARRSYYQWSEDEQCYVYQDGTKIPVRQENQSLASSYAPCLSDSIHYVIKAR
jgi:hypothetical protein